MTKLHIVNTNKNFTLTSDEMDMTFDEMERWVESCILGEQALMFPQHDGRQIACLSKGVLDDCIVNIQEA